MVGVAAPRKNLPIVPVPCLLAMAASRTRNVSYAGEWVGVQIPRRSMLVVDDDASVRKLLDAIFAPEFEITFAEDCRQGIVAIAAGAYDIVLTDYSMPEGSGWDVLLAAHKFLPNARLALVSSNPPPDVREKAAAMGAAISPKPFDLVELHDLVSGLVNRPAPPKVDTRMRTRGRHHEMRELSCDGWWSVQECVRCRMAIVYLHVGVDLVTVYPVSPSDICVA